MVQQQYGRLEINFSLKKPKTPYKTLAVQECFYSAGPLSTETTEIHRVSISEQKKNEQFMQNKRKVNDDEHKEFKLKSGFSLCV